MLVECLFKVTTVVLDESRMFVCVPFLIFVLRYGP